MGHVRPPAKSAKFTTKIVPFTHTGNQDTIFSSMVKKNETATNKQRLIGYARVSKGEQNLDLQMDALTDVGCDRQLVFVDKVSGAKSKRPGLDACIEELQDGDVLIVWRLDRLGRSMPHLISTIEELKERGIGFRSISDGVVDTTSPSGELVFNIFSALAQFERRLIQERTKAGLEAARAKGRQKTTLTR
jgi:DNA invertase Pin-like site-specific DNA recombinase